MNIIDIPLDSVPFDQLGDHIARLKEYLRSADDPNEAAANGSTCISIALLFCNEEEGIDILQSLLARGGNPNLPSPFQNYLACVTAATSLAPLEYLIDAGLELNEVYTAAPGFLLTEDRPFTMLDYALDLRAYLGKNRKPLAALTNKYAGGGFGQRRLFVENVIGLLQTHGAKRAADQTAE
jgi:ankyrin repeat protein